MAAAFALGIAGVALVALGSAIAADVRGLGRKYVLLGVAITFWVGGANSFRRHQLWARLSAGVVMVVIGVAWIVFAFQLGRQ